MVLLGVGAGLVFPSLMTLAMSAATPEDSGLASGLVNTTQQVGGALGLAVLATLSTTRTDSLRGHGASNAVALTNGYHLAFTVAAALVLAAIALGVFLLRPPQTLHAVGEPTDAAEVEVEPAAYLEEAA
jgi:MFS family permease